MLTTTDRAKRYLWNGDDLDDYEVRPGNGKTFTLATDALTAFDCDEQKKLTHAAVNYHEGAKEDRCARCIRFNPQEDGSHGCQVVQKPIAEDGWCELFEVRKEAEDGILERIREGYNFGRRLAGAQDENPNIERRVNLPFGLTVYIENEEGSLRKGPWGEMIMKHPYGYLSATEGVDGDAVDCFLGKDYSTASTVYVVHQGAPDPEDKLMIGFNSAKEAADAYELNYHPEPPDYTMEKLQLRDLPAKLNKFRGKRIRGA